MNNKKLLGKTGTQGGHCKFEKGFKNLNKQIKLLLELQKRLMKR